MEDGGLAWKRSLRRRTKSPIQRPNSAASPTPVTDGRNVYVFFQDFGLAAFSLEGAPIWEFPLGPFNNFYGMAASPILVDDLLVQVCDQSTGSFIIALDKASGKTRWRSERPEAADGYSTPTLYQPKGAPHQILVAGSFELAAYRATDGEKMWWAGGLGWQIKAIPVLWKDRVFINGRGSLQTPSSARVRVPPFEEVLADQDKDADGQLSRSESEGNAREWFSGIDRDRSGGLDQAEWDFYRRVWSGEGGLLVIRAGGRGDMTRRSLLWRYDRSVAEIPSLIIHQGMLYMVRDGGIITAFDPETGKVVKQQRLPTAVDDYLASPVAVGGRIYFLSRNGTLSMIRVDNADWEATPILKLGEESYATPALANGRIYLRASEALYCVGS